MLQARVGLAALAGLIFATTQVSTALAVPFPEARAAFDEDLSPEQRIMSQVLLSATGYLPDVPMDHLTRKTFDAITTFEADNGFAASGVLDASQISALIAAAAPDMRRWGFRKVYFPGRPFAIWAPVGLGMQVQENATGLHYRDDRGRISLDMVSIAGLSARAAHDNQRADAARHAATIHYDSYKRGDDWFAISATWADGSDHYYRYHQDGSRVTGFALQWNNEVENISAERIATIMSGSLRSAMTGAPFIDPPSIPADDPVVAQAPPQVSSATADPAGCSAVKDANARLACFDAAAGGRQASSAVSPAASPPVVNTTPQNLAPPEEKRSVAVAAPVATALGVDDLAAMKGTYSDNQARFFRDYKDHRFAATMPMDSVVENIFSRGTFNINLGQSDQVSCPIADETTLKLVTDLNKGASVRVQGYVSDEVFGVVHLRDCELSKG